VAEQTNIFKRLWNHWLVIAAKIAHVQGHIILSIIYILIVAPVAMLFKIFAHDPFETGNTENPKSFWADRPPIDSVESFLKKEF